MRFRSLVFSIAIMTASLAAHADSFHLTFSGSGENGSVLLTAKGTATSGEFLITSATGSIDSTSITLLTPGTYPSVGPNDNLLFFPAIPSQASFDTDGVSFLLADGTDYNLYQQAGQYFATMGAMRSVSDITSVVVTSASAVTPEPSSFLLLGTGLLSVCGLVRLRLCSTPCE